MAGAPLGTLVRLVRGLAGASDSYDSADDHLLQRYARRRDGDAFAALVHRHGRLVWSVCRRVLHHDADAEDAFQATFLALARYASTIRAGAAVASWLYRVAHRVATKAIRERDARQAREHEAKWPMHAQPDDDVSWRELRALIDEELQRLPEKYQAPFLLCCLEGKSKAEAARQLGWKEGTVSGRLAEARKRMRSRLLHRGVMPSAALSAAVLGHSLAAAVPVSVVTNTIRVVAGAAVAPVPAKVALLAEGACKAMSMSKAKVVVAVLLVGGLFAGGTRLLSRPALEARPPEEPAAIAAEAPPEKPAEAPPEKRAEEPPAPEPPPPAEPNDRLDAVLHGSNRALEKVESLSCEFKRTDRDRALGKTTDYQGTVRFLEPNLFVLEMRKKDAPKEFGEKLVCDGKNLYLYRSADQTVLRFDAANIRRGYAASCFIGMTPEEARHRYEMTLRKEDQWYAYLEIRPRLPDDAKEFVQARLVFSKDTMLPRQLWWRLPNDNEVTWDVTRVNTGVKLNPQDFKATIPNGWKLRPMDPPDSVKQP